MPINLPNGPESLSRLQKGRARWVSEFQIARQRSAYLHAADAPGVEANEKDRRGHRGIHCKLLIETKTSISGHEYTSCSMDVSLAYLISRSP